MRVFLQPLEHYLQALGEYFIVAVDVHDPLPCGAGDAEVARRARTAVGFFQIANALILDGIHDGSCVVAGPIVDHDNFEVWEGLAQNAVYGCCDGMRTVESW